MLCCVVMVMCYHRMFRNKGGSFLLEGQGWPLRRGVVFPQAEQTGGFGCWHLWTVGTVLVRKTALRVALQAGGHCWNMSCLLQPGHSGGEGARET